MRPVIYYRSPPMLKDELEVASKYFNCVSSRMYLKAGDLCIPRYSAWPFIKELEHDVNYLGAKVINSLQQHNYIADLKNYVSDLGTLTPKTWFQLSSVPKDGGPFVLKGETNSKKESWLELMYAKTWDEASSIYSKLCTDGIIGNQEIYIREYVPLANLGWAIGGLPLTKEFRFFICDKQIVSGGFYWDAFADDIIFQGHKIPSVDEAPIAFLQKVIDIVDDKARFYTIDVAQTEAGEWIVIELNDGMFAGLCGNDPNIFYERLRKIVS